MQGWKPQKPTKLDGNDTTTSTHHPYILCDFANYAHRKTLYMHLAYSYALNEQSNQLYSLHGLRHKRRPISAMFSSSKISQHNLNSNKPYRPSIAHAVQFLHTVKTDHTCHAQYSNCIHYSHLQHNSLSMHINALHTHYYTPILTPLPPTTSTKCICVSGGKMAQDVGMVCSCCGFLESCLESST